MGCMKIVNRNYNREYEEIEKFEAGIALTGPEVKSIRAGNMRLENAFIRVTVDGAFLFNAEIGAYVFAKNEEYDPRRTRQLLLNKKELGRLKAKIHSSPSLTIIPMLCYNKGSLIKLEIALSRGRKDLEKRKREKERDIRLQEKREAKEYEKS